MIRMGSMSHCFSRLRECQNPSRRLRQHVALKPRIRFVLAGFLFFCILFYGTAISQAQQGDGQPAGSTLGRPDTVYIANFQLQVNPEENASGKERPLRVGKRVREAVDHVGVRNQGSPQEKAASIVNLLAQTIVDELNKNGVRSLRLPAQPRTFVGSWLLEGEFLDYDEGSASKKAVIGFGVGSPQMEVHLLLSEFTGSGSNVLVDTALTGRTDRKPGAAVTKNPYIAGAKFVLAKNASEKDVKKLGSEIANTVYQFMKSKGLAN